MKKLHIRLLSITFALPMFAAMMYFGSAAFAADEICTSCGPQVSVSGSFTHHKDRPCGGH